MKIVRGCDNFRFFWRSKYLDVFFFSKMRCNKFKVYYDN